MIYRSTPPLTLRLQLSWVIAWLTFSAMTALAKPNLRFEHVFQYFPDHKRPLGAMVFITRDHDGLMWFANEMVYRYDGVEIRSYPDSQRRFCTGFARGMVVDDDGVLWIATGSGLCVYNRQQDRFEPFYLTQSNEPLDLGPTTAVNVSPENEIYIGMTNQFAVISADRSNITLHKPPPTAIRHDPSNEFRAIFFESANIIWIGSQKSGVIRFNRRTGEFSSIRNTAENPNVLPSNDVRSIVKDASGTLWIGMHQGGISRLTAGSQQFKHYYQGKNSDGPNAYVWHLLIDSSGQLWATSNGAGLMGYDEASDSFFHYLHDPYDQNSIASNKPSYIFEDQDQNLWISVYPEGLELVNRQHTAIQTYRHSPLVEHSVNANGILRILMDRQQRIWVGTEKGLNLFDRHSGRFTDYSQPSPLHWHINPAPVTAIKDTPNGDMWIGTWGDGLYFVDGKTQQITHYHPQKDGAVPVDASHFWDILPGETETWFATEGQKGILSFDHQTKQFSRKTFKTGDLELNSQYIYALLKDSRGDTWIGTIGGLYKVDPHGTLSLYSQRNSGNHNISSIHIRTLFEDSRGRIWVGTEDQGVFIYNPLSKTFTQLSEKSGIPSPIVTSIAQSSDGFIWVFTRNGLVRVNPTDFQLSVFNNAHGLVSSNFNRGAGMIDPHNIVYAGGAKGLSVFHVDDIGSGNTDFPVHITDFKLFNQTVDVDRTDSPLSNSILLTEQIHLDHDQHTFTFSFAGLSYPLSHWNQYAYILENFEKEWNYVGNRTFATYTNVPPGRYTFKVRAMNSDGNWSQSSDSLDLSITPPPWKTLWAYLLYLATFALLIRFAVRYRIGKIEYAKQKALNAEIVRLEKERDEMRRKFIADISHDLKTPLSILAGELEAIEDGVRTASAQALASLSYEVKIVNKLVNDLFDLSLADIGELHYNFRLIDLRTSITEVLSLTATKFASKNIRVTATADSHPLTVNADPLRIHQLFLNILENSFRYTDAPGEVVLTAKLTEKSVFVTLCDSAPTVSEQHMGNLFQRLYRAEPSRNRARGGTGLGLAICRNIAEAHHATITASTAAIGGLCITLTFPRGDHHDGS